MIFFSTILFILLHLAINLAGGTKLELHELNQKWKHNNIGIKHDFPFINILKVPREVLKTEGEARGFQHLQRDFAIVNEWQNHVWSLSLHKFKENTPKIEKMFAHFILQPYHHFLRVHAFYKYPLFRPWPGTFFHGDLKA